MQGSSREQALAAMQAAIVSGRLRPGEKLGEADCAGRLGVSRNTLREVFADLASRGLVERIAHRGVFVARPGPAEVRELYRVRAMLEPAALLWSDRLRPADLRRAAAAGEAALAAHSGDAGSQHTGGHDTGAAAANANQEFHRVVLAGIGEDYAGRIMDRVLGVMRLVFATAGGDPTRFHEPFLRRNSEIAEMFAAGRRAEAAEAMREYLHEAEAGVLAAMPPA